MFFETPITDVRQDSKNHGVAFPSNVVLFTTLEACLTGSKMNIGQVHSAAILESILWQNYQVLKKTDGSCDTALPCGARLWFLLLGHGSPSLYWGRSSNSYLNTSCLAMALPSTLTPRLCYLSSEPCLRSWARRGLRWTSRGLLCLALNQEVQRILRQREYVVDHLRCIHSWLPISLIHRSLQERKASRVWVRVVTHACQRHCPLGSRSGFRC